jgi:hypothetical protein
MASLNPLNSNKEPWVHLELGAANYGENGYSKRHGGHDSQFLPLYHTIDELIQTHGPNTPGIFYVNDFYEDACKYSCGRLRDYISKTYPETKIQLASIVKDYFEIDILADCGVEKVDSIHLKNPERYQLLYVCTRPNWLLKMSEGSRSLFTLITGYRNFFSDDRWFCPARKKSERSLRYEQDPTPPLNYLYFEPDGTLNPEWEQTTRRYSIRLAAPDEQYTPAEMSERWGKKQSITQRIETIAKEIFEKTAAKIQSNPKYPLIQAFARTRCQSVMAPSFTFNSSDLNWIQNLDSYEPTEYVGEIEKRAEKMLSFFSESYRLAENPLSVSSQSIPGALNFLAFKRFLSKKSPEELWNRLGLGDAYRKIFSNDADFWNSEFSLSEIHQKLSVFL